MNDKNAVRCARPTTQKVGVLRLYDRADGVKGHYCIGRLRKDGTHEFWHTNKFCSAGDVFVGKEAARSQLDALSAPVLTSAEFNGALQWAINFFENIDSAGCSRSECKKAREVAEVLTRRLRSKG